MVKTIDGKVHQVYNILLYTKNVKKSTGKFAKTMVFLWHRGRDFEFAKSSKLFSKMGLTQGFVCGIIAEHGKVGYDPGGC